MSLRPPPWRGRDGTVDDRRHRVDLFDHKIDVSGSGSASISFRRCGARNGERPTQRYACVIGLSAVVEGRHGAEPVEIAEAASRARFAALLPQFCPCQRRTMTSVCHQAAVRDGRG